MINKIFIFFLGYKGDTTGIGLFNGNKSTKQMSLHKEFTGICR
ncbi:hypothetical protein [Granulicatella sp. zg-ZJ]|nr:hypothetical protein [Granulicatella sp. zg-ZJ]